MHLTFRVLWQMAYEANRLTVYLHSLASSSTFWSRLRPYKHNHVNARIRKHIRCEKFLIPLVSFRSHKFYMQTGWFLQVLMTTIE